MTLIVSPLPENEISTVTQLYNSYAEFELPYKKMSLPKWKELFLTDTPQIKKILLQAVTDDIFIGFAGGCMNLLTGDCYITFVLVAKEFRRKGIGKALLQALEQSLTEQRNGLGFPVADSKIQITFFNPCALTWLIPDTTGHDHPNAPGVDVSSDAHAFFKSMGYESYVYQNSFYLPLKDYHEPEFVAVKKEDLAAQGITFEFYDSSKHYGLKDLCEDLGNPVWKEELPANDALGKDGHPLMAAIRENQIIGFTGPLRIQESGRGYFSGIGVHSSCRGLGLGSLLFHILCTTLKDMGADFMTLFTGETNPAAKIYEKAGFQIVKTWADMEKKI